VPERLAERMSESELTVRELEVLQEIVNGKSNKEIASSLLGSLKAQHHDRLRRDIQDQLRTLKLVTAERRWFDGVWSFERVHRVHR
jgi:FixJ family two-component response regulator